MGLGKLTRCQTSASSLSLRPSRYSCKQSFSASAKGVCAEIDGASSDRGPSGGYGSTSEGEPVPMSATDVPAGEAPKESRSSWPTVPEWPAGLVFVRGWRSFHLTWREYLWVTLFVRIGRLLAWWPIWPVT